MRLNQNTSFNLRESFDSGKKSTIKVEGIKGGLKMMEHIGGYLIKMESEIKEKVDIEKSAGPSTVILITIEEENIERVKRIIKKPFRVWGRII